MSDSIDRTLAIATLVMAKETGSLMCKELKGVIEVLNRMPPAQQWIPCNKRLPDAECGESDIVLATCGYMNVKDTRVRWIKTLYFNGGNWCYPTGETYEQKVYAWMPLPEPYKEASE